MRLIASAKLSCAVLAACMLAGFESPACAQDIEPRAYSNAPVGVNFLIAGYAYTRGGVAFGPSLPITNPNLNTSNAVVAYARVLDLWGMSAKFDATVPYTWLSGTADYRGQTVPRTVDGFANSAFRLSVNLYGAPALTLKEFADWEQDLIIGASFRVVAPWGQYDDSKLVNIGTNRWSFKPEVGISKAIGPWTMEVEAAATLYTDNNDFFGGKTLSQAPLYSLQGHLIYGFRSGIWASLDATYFVGGRTTVNGVLNSDLQQNWRVGGTLAFPGEPGEFDQALRQQRGVGTHRRQLRPDRRSVAIPLGWRIVMPSRSQAPARGHSSSQIEALRSRSLNGSSLRLQRPLLALTNVDNGSNCDLRRPNRSRSELKVADRPVSDLAHRRLFLPIAAVRLGVSPWIWGDMARP